MCDLSGLGEPAVAVRGVVGRRAAEVDDGDPASRSQSKQRVA
jgi:hypothetical protein